MSFFPKIFTLGKLTRVVSIQSTPATREGKRKIVGASTHHDKLAFDLARPRQAVVVLPLTQRARVDIGRKVANGGRDAGVERAAEGEVAAEAHSRGAYAAVALGQGEEKVDGEGGVLIIG